MRLRKAAGLEKGKNTARPPLRTEETALMASRAAGPV